MLAVVGTIGKNIPIVNTYTNPMRIGGVLLFILGVWFEGGYSVEMSYRARIAEMQAKIDAAAIKSEAVNVKIEKKIEQNTIYIREKVAEDAKEIEQNRNEIDGGCKLSDTAWMLYNRTLDPKIPAGSTSVNGTSERTK
jgi:hypothetical protein